MNILKVIHGYPPRYNAGSEVYSKQICDELAKRSNQINVFTRYEDIYERDYFLKEEFDPANPKIRINLINLPKLRFPLSYIKPELDQIFENLIKETNPDIIHIGHLNHLSTSIIDLINKYKIPIIYTLHDYWLMCPRGQFIQRNSKSPWELCDKQENSKCAKYCFKGFFSDSGSIDTNNELSYWTGWVAKRMKHIEEIASKIDLFIAPSRYIQSKFINDFNISQNKITYLDYGFDIKYLSSRDRKSENSFVFGYIGTHIPAKGIHDLIRAFSFVEGESLLRIWGREREETQNLKDIINSIDERIANKIQWMGEYTNEEILQEVFNRVDAIVVPSIWVENSPLVIHESLQSRVPVITANVGGMSEQIQHNVNGLLFEHRNYKDLAFQMQKLMLDPEYARKLGEYGYLYSNTGDVMSINEHVDSLEMIYETLIKEKMSNL